MPNGSVVLWVNDTPDERQGNSGDPCGHGHVYHDRTRPVAVSFEATNGTCTRVSFDPGTGAISVQDLTDAPCLDGRGQS